MDIHLPLLARYRPDRANSARVAACGYATESGAIRDWRCTYPARDHAVESWLQDHVASDDEALTPDPSTMVATTSACR